MRVAILGTGRMGFPLATRLVRAGHVVRAWDAYDRAEPLARRGITVMPTAAEAVADVDAVVTVMGPKLVREVLVAVADSPNLPTGCLVLDCSTVGVELAVELDALLRDRGVRYMEAPLVGRPQEARKGRIGVFLGGAPEDAEEASQLALAFTAPLTTWYVGPIGRGNALKAVFNASVALTAAALGETMRLAQETGLDRTMVLDSLALGPFAWAISRRRTQFETMDFSEVENSLDRVVRELALATQSARRELPLLRETQRVATEAVAAGHGREDVASLVAYIEQEGRPNSY